MGDFLTQEAGPLPYWAWFAIALGVACILIAAILIPCLVKRGDKKQEEGEELSADDNKSATEVKKEEKREEVKPAVEEKPAEEKPAAKKTTTTKTTAKSTTAKSTAKATTAKSTTAKKEDSKPADKDEGASGAKVYHISKRKEDKKWQVKAEGADKALRLFFTQTDAIEYAKKVAGNQEGRIVIHKEGGGFRKLNY